MLLVLLILSVVSVCVTIVCTYFLLNAEDYRWYVTVLQVQFSEKFQTETKPIPMKWQLQKPNTKPIFILPKIPIFNQILTRASSKYR